ncbi:MAG: glycosyltransferase family 2 protein [Gammaproteobacteria bacterium]|jgi:glycosyltransferase involved in cell wall biosynthesis|nr:glycosyltransferase family 2 protein [Gammaproteobacteria bacterium]
MGSRQLPATSFLIPVLNEAATIVPLAQQIMAVTAGSLIEIIFIDDGSSDDSWAKITTLAAEHEVIKGIRLRRNFGKARALAAGVEVASAAVLVTMDADLQDDPNEIPQFLKQIEQGYDIVSGWKKDRRDPLGKTIPSKLFNFITRVISGVNLKDFNCGFKAARTEVYRNIPLYGELHRYVPVLAHALGYSYCEIPVVHHPRRAGKSKYGLERYARGFIDLITVIAITRFGQRPAHLFGGAGLLTGLFAAGIMLYLLVIKLFMHVAIGDRPLLMLGVLLAILSAQLMTLGILAEVIINRTSGPESKILIAASAGLDR